MSTNVVTRISAARVRKLCDARLVAKAAFERAKAELDAIDNEFKTLGPGTYLGRDAVIEVSDIASTRFDQKRAKGFLTAGQLAECAVPYSYIKVTSKELTP